MYVVFKEKAAQKRTKCTAFALFGSDEKIGKPFLCVQREGGGEENHCFKQALMI